MINFHIKSSGDMSEIENQSVHLIITSPPYPMIKKWDSIFGIVDFDKQHKILFKTWMECGRVLISGGIACINIGDATRTIDGKGFTCYPNFARVTNDMWRLGFTPLIPIFWKKISNRPNAFLGSGFLPPNCYVSQDHEYIAIFRKGFIRKFQPKDPNRYESSFTKEERDLWFQQVWNIQGVRGAKETSTFPPKIPYRLIRMFSVKGDTVLDPFCGTGIVAKMASELGRNGIGYDIENHPSWYIGLDQKEMESCQ